jgi:hypothetical protein
MERAYERSKHAPDLTVSNTSSPSQVQLAKEELLVLTIKKEIADAIVTLVQKRLNAAETEGRVSEEFRVQLEQKYVVDVLQLKKQIEQRRKLIHLHELEQTQNTLIFSFNEKLEILNHEIQNIRTALSIAPPDEEQRKSTESYYSLIED